METYRLFLRGKAKEALGEVTVDAACARRMGLKDGQSVSKAQMQKLMLMQLNEFSSFADSIGNSRPKKVRRTADRHDYTGGRLRKDVSICKST